MATTKNAVFFKQKQIENKKFVVLQILKWFDFITRLLKTGISFRVAPTILFYSLITISENVTVSFVDVDECKVCIKNNNTTLPIIDINAKIIIIIARMQSLAHFIWKLYFAYILNNNFSELWTLTF
jgi:hypothetical protein